MGVQWVPGGKRLQLGSGWLKPGGFPADVIRQAVWLYFRFILSFRDLEEMLAQRGIDVSYESIR